MASCLRKGQPTGYLREEVPLKDKVVVKQRLDDVARKLQPTASPENKRRAERAVCYRGSVPLAKQVKLVCSRS